MTSFSITAQASSHKQRHLVTQFDVLEDPKSELSETQALNLEDWRKINQPSLNFGYTQSTYWVKFNLHNESSQDIVRLIDFTYPLLDKISLFKIADNQPELIFHSGDTYPYHQRNVDHPHFVAKVELPQQSEQSYLVRLQSNSPIQTEVISWDLNRFQKHYRDINASQFLYIGLVLSVALLNLLIFIYLREAVYITYAGYAACLGLLVSSQSGVLFEYVYPEWPIVHKWSQLVFATLTILLTTLFSLKFLRLNTSGACKKPLQGLLSAPILVLVISPIIGYQLAIQSIVLVGLLVIPACFFMGVFVAQKNPDRDIFLIAWSFLIIGACIFLFSKLGILPFNGFTNNAVQIGSTLELFTFSLALARRIYIEREARLTAKQAIIDSNKRSAKLQESMLFTATHDAITQLPNRNNFETFLQYTLRQYEHGVLVVCHLQRMNDIDKTMGKDMSNLALHKFAMMLNIELAENNLALAIDHKEGFYAATLSASSHGFLLNPKFTNIYRTIESIKDAVDRTYAINEMELELEPQFAFIEFPKFGKESDKLMRQVGIALDAAKSCTSHIAAYHPDIDPYDGRRLVLMTELKRAIADDTLDLHFQPIVDTRHQNIIGAEALIRWPHNEFGLIMPDEFIEMAERSGLIQALSIWVIKRSLQILRRLHKINPSLFMAVNISTFNLQDDKFIKALLVLLEKSSDLCRHVVLEITESQMMSDTQDALENLWSLNEQGVKIAIDDFGTGYSSLAYLKKLPAEELKIDKEFIFDLETDKQNQVLVHTAIEMAHNLGMTVVAEGVESEHTRRILEDLNCDMCQGYHFARPMDVDRFAKYLATEHSGKDISNQVNN
ncbi:EAL domain-containing protein [Bermanella marisrubri]|uniref:Predicted signal transduction protein containing sensor and EAL domains n=1 Tax=Bermanella marisrubri TaxID=207949 RepID=Q1MXU8_9GAMM|nr:EAL domain-containing protein [Bermanella marisrubri]EAT10789.1 predicted signal transduction protein containing sensor and EAL domains [Oceanobacter sp. RED65] [Bermanella marisrubri]QIZ84251.1 EAL domain-containing protein [Bermanella marisrubri]